MKLTLLVCAITALAASRALLLAQQETALPAVEPQPSGTPAALGTPAPQLIPADLLPAPATVVPAVSVPTIPQLDAAFSPPPAPAATQEQRAHLEWRTLRNRLENDPKFRASLARAEAAPTDLEKRNRLRTHYEEFYARLIALASPEWKPYMTARKTDVLNTLPQPRVRPSVTPAKKPAG